MSVESGRVFADLLAFIFNSFDREKTGRVSAIELACAIAVLCDGKKSDKLEYAFEMLDGKRQGRLNRRDVGVYLRSFLTVLLCVTSSSHLRSNPSEDTVHFMNGKHCDADATAIIRAVDAGRVSCLWSLMFRVCDD
jgi:Ca2+-binding EF-hand superfamily protein